MECIFLSHRDVPIFQELLLMVHKILIKFLCAFLLSAAILSLSLIVTYASTNASPKPMLTLNRQQGPLGVKLTLKGKKFHPGQANLSYIDAQNVPDVFAVPSDSSVQVQPDGTFVTANLVMPSSGPAGAWKVMVTDSRQTIATTRYLVLAAPGQQNAGTPGLTLNPTSGKGGDVIAFTGSNWLPQGIVVKLTLLSGTGSLSLLNTPFVSDKNGSIMGAFHVPTNLDTTPTLATVTATDATGALRAQVEMTVLSLSPTPSTSPIANPRAAPVSTASPMVSSGGSDIGGPFPPLDRDALGLVLLVVGGTLGIAALMLILFLVPWEEPKRSVPRSRQYW